MTGSVVCKFSKRKWRSSVKHVNPLSTKKQTQICIINFACGNNLSSSLDFSPFLHFGGGQEIFYFWHLWLLATRGCLKRRNIFSKIEKFNTIFAISRFRLRISFRFIVMWKQPFSQNPFIAKFHWSMLPSIFARKVPSLHKQVQQHFCNIWQKFLMGRSDRIPALYDYGIQSSNSSIRLDVNDDQHSKLW